MMYRAVSSRLMPVSSGSGLFVGPSGVGKSHAAQGAWTHRLSQGIRSHLRTHQRVARLDPRVTQFRSEVAARFDDFDRRLDYVLWSRLGIRLESLFRRTMVALLEQSLGVGVQQRTIAGEQFQVVIQ